MDDSPLTVPALLADAVRRFGERSYVVTPGGTPDARLTYAQAEEQSADKARWLLANGAGKGTRVGLFFANDIEWVTWWLAVSRIGALAVPLSTLYRPAEIGKVLRLADVALLIAPKRLLDIDVAQRLEAALPGLAAHRTPHLQIATAPYLRSIAITGGGDASWATTVDGAQAVSSDILLSAHELVFPAEFKTRF